MAQVPLRRTLWVQSRAALSAWWPVDWLFAGYLLAVAALVFLYRNRVPHAAWLLGLHAAGIALIALCARLGPGTLASLVFRHCYPIPYVYACYREMSILIPAIRRLDFDQEMARVDFALWGVHPTVWLERFHQPWLSEFFEIVYGLFVPSVLFVAFLLWQRRRYADFRYYAFLVSLGFLASFVGYLLVPVRGPRFLLAHLQQVELRGLWSFSAVRDALDFLESKQYDCFPSGHAELALLAWWSMRRISPGIFGAYAAYTLCLLLSTVYLRYHYTVDLAAGLLLAIALLPVARRLYRYLSPKPEEEFSL